MGHIPDGSSRRFAGLSYFDIIRSNGLWDFAVRAFPESEVEESIVANCRRVTLGDLERHTAHC
jgi:hypothetical protein